MPKTIKALSIKEPWASAIFILGKDVENRNWKTDYRGPLVIHAGKSVEWAVINQPHSEFTYKIYPGHIIGVVNLVDITFKSNSEWADENSSFYWNLGIRFGARPFKFQKPIPYNGQLGLFNVPLRLLNKAGYHLP